MGVYGELEYFNYTIYSREFEGMYERNSVHLAQAYSNYITLYVWEYSDEHIKGYLHE